MELGLHDRLQRAERDGGHSTGSPPVATLLLWPKQEFVEKKISVLWIPRKELMTSFGFFFLIVKQSLLSYFAKFASRILNKYFLKYALRLDSSILVHVSLLRSGL